MEKLTDRVIANVFAHIRYTRGWEEYWATIPEKERLELLKELRAGIRKDLGE